MPKVLDVLWPRLEEQENASWRGTVNRVYCSDILGDTSATHIFVHRRLVSNNNILDSEVNIKCADGDTITYPLELVMEGETSLLWQKSQTLNTPLFCWDRMSRYL